MTETTEKTTEQGVDIFALPNVQQDKDPIALGHFPTRLKRLVWALAKEHPLWKFKAHNHRSFEVLKDGEVLGYVGEEWYGSNMALLVRNERIAKANERKSAYHTQDIQKAILKVKKTFSPMTLIERIVKAKEEADSVITRQHGSVARRCAGARGKLQRGLLEYAEAHMSQYILWLKDNNKLTMLDDLHELQELQADMKTIEETKKAFGDTNKHALVVLADGKYMVKVLDNVNLYDDTTLPQELRGKLGMLKLVEKEQMVTGIGCRVSDEIFVLLIEEKTDEPT